jgi:flagellar motility protein MotE (MotC chaperone)
MEKFSGSKLKTAQPLCEKKELEEQLETIKELDSMSTEQLKELEKERNDLKMRFVSHFHTFPSASFSPFM